MTERIVARDRCANDACGHTAGLHGERAGVGPGGCCLPGCACGAFVRPTPARVRLPNPRDDRDLYLAYQRAATTVLEGDPATGYELLMDEIIRWVQRALAPRMVPAPAEPPLTERAP